MLSVANLHFSYPDLPALLRGLTFHLQPGEIVSLIGTSGTGKSTLLKLLIGILRPCKGEVIVQGASRSTSGQSMSYMMQEDLLLPWRTVLSNVTLAGELGPTPRTSIKLVDEARHLLGEMGLDGWETALPEELSGGMRQRVSLARALLLRKPILLLDEPFGALDVILREQMYALLRDIQVRRGTTILMVTHDFRDAFSLSDRILHLQQGGIVEEWVIDDKMRHQPEAFGKIHEQLRQALSEARG